MPKSIIIYVTRDGHSSELAARAGKRLDAPVHEIVDLANRKGITGILRAGAQASMKIATPITDPGMELSGVNLVVLVQPV